ncbi:TPA: hypothetical protein ACUNQU_005216, partial [Salmonella enterica]
LSGWAEMVMNMNDLILINENARASQYDQLKAHREAPGTATTKRNRTVIKGYFGSPFCIQLP